MIKTHILLWNMVNRAKALIRKEEGFTTIEYGLITALIAVVVIATISRSLLH